MWTGSLQWCHKQDHTLSSHLSVAVPLLFVLFMLHCIPVPTLFSCHPCHYHSSFILKVTKSWDLKQRTRTAKMNVVSFRVITSGGYVLLISGLLSSHAFLPRGPSSWPTWISSFPHHLPQPPVELRIILCVLPSSVQSQHVWKCYVWVGFFNTSNGRG